jgi:hypothetical protein
MKGEMNCELSERGREGGAKKEWIGAKDDDELGTKVGQQREGLLLSLDGGFVVRIRKHKGKKSPRRQGDRAGRGEEPTERLRMMEVSRRWRRERAREGKTESTMTRGKRVRG